MKKIALLCFSLLTTAIVFAQELKADDEEIKIDKQVIAKIEKEKNGKFSIPAFTLVNSSGTLLARMDERSYIAKPGTLGENYYSISFPSWNDSVQLSYEQFTKIQKIPLFGMKDETVSKFIVKTNLLAKDGSLNKDEFAKLKTQFPENLTAKYAAAAASQDKCAKSIATLVSRDKSKPVTINEVKREETTPGKVVAITYEIKQGDVLIGSVVATGNPAVAKDARAEIDYAPGIASLDGDDTPMNYTFKNNEGCTAATYTGTSRVVFTSKDNTSKSTKAILGNRFGDVQSRNDLIKEGAIYLAANGYL